MIAFFRIQSPLALPLLVLYGLLLNAVSIWRSLSGQGLHLAEALTARGHGSVLWEGVYGAPSAEAGTGTHWLVLILGVLLVVLQAAMINRLMRNIKGLDVDGYLPALAYTFLAIVLGADFDPATLGALFLLMAFDRLLEAYGRVRADEDLLQAAVYTGVASLLCWPYAVFLLFAGLAAARLRPLSGREFGILVTGFSAVYALAWTWSFVAGNPQQWAESHFQWNLALDTPKASAPVLLRYLIPFLVTVGAFAFAQLRLLRSLVLVRKTTGLAAWFGVFAAIAWFTGAVPATAVAVSGAYFLAYFARRSGWARSWEVGHVLALVGWYAAAWVG